MVISTGSSDTIMFSSSLFSFKDLYAPTFLHALDHLQIVVIHMHRKLSQSRNEECKRIEAMHN